MRIERETVIFIRLIRLQRDCHIGFFRLFRKNLLNRLVGATIIPNDLVFVINILAKWHPFKFQLVLMGTHF